MANGFANDLEVANNGINGLLAVSELFEALWT